MSEEQRRVPTPLPKHPYGYTLLVNLALAAVLFLFSWVLSRSIADSVFYAAAFILIGTALGWYRVWKRLARERE